MVFLLSFVQMAGLHFLHSFLTVQELWTCVSQRPRLIVHYTRAVDICITEASIVLAHAQEPWTFCGYSSLRLHCIFDCSLYKSRGHTWTYISQRPRSFLLMHNAQEPWTFCGHASLRLHCIFGIYI